jgi:WD40 repeat protein
MFDLMRNLLPKIAMGVGGSTWDSIASRLFGYDIFVSFALGRPPRGTRNYASDLTRRLKDHDFRVFFSEEEAAPGEALDADLQKALFRSRALVVVANKETLNDPRWVQVEVEKFRERHPKRPVITINVEGAIHDPSIKDRTNKWLGHLGKIWLDETEGAVREGKASDDLVERLAITPRHARVNTLWKTLVFGVVFLLLTLTILSFKSANRARSELKKEVSLRLVSDADKMITGQQEGDNLKVLQNLIAAYRIMPGTVTEGGLMSALLHYRDLKKIVTDKEPIIAMTYSPDGSQIVVGREDCAVEFWDAKTGNFIRRTVFENNEDALINKMFINVAKGRAVATVPVGGGELTVRVYDINTGVLTVKCITLKKDELTDVKMSPDGMVVITVTNERQANKLYPEKVMRLWDASTGQMIGLPIINHGCERVEFSPDGRFVASGNSYYKRILLSEIYQKTVRLIDLKTGNMVWESIRGSSDVGYVSAMAFSRDGSRFVVGDSKGFLQVLDASTGGQINKIKGHEAYINSLAFSLDGRYIASTSQDRTVKIWNAVMGVECSALMKNSTFSGSSIVTYSPDGRELTYASFGGTVEIWRTSGWESSQNNIGKVIWPETSITCTSKDGRLVALGYGDGSILVFDAASGKLAGPLIKGYIGLPSIDRFGGIEAMCFDPDGNSIIACHFHGEMQRWDVKTGKNIGSTMIAGENFLFHPVAVAVSNDGKKIITGAEYGQLQMWDAQSQQPIGGEMKGSIAMMLKTIKYSVDGQRIILGGDFGELELLDADSGKHLAGERNFKKSLYSGFLACLAESVDGKYLVTGTENGSLSLWDSRTLNLVKKVYNAHLGKITSIGFSPDGKYIISAGEDRTERFWEAGSMKMIGEPLRLHEYKVERVTFCDEGRRIFSVDANKIVKSWPAPVGWVDELSSRINRNMTDKEWKERVSSELDYFKQSRQLPIAKEKRAFVYDY